MAVYSCTSKNHTSTTQTRCAFHQPSCSLVLRVLKHGSLIIWQNSSRSTLLLVAWRSHCKMTDWVVKHIIMLTSFSGKISSNYKQEQVCAITSTISRLAHLVDVLQEEKVFYRWIIGTKGHLDIRYGEWRIYCMSVL